MSKYTTAQLQEMALKFMFARKTGDKRCAMLLMMLSLATGVSQVECIVKIERLARGETV